MGSTGSSQKNVTQDHDQPPAKPPSPECPPFFPEGTAHLHPQRDPSALRSKRIAGGVGHNGQWLMHSNNNRGRVFAILCSCGSTCGARTPQGMRDAMRGSHVARHIFWMLEAHSPWSHEYLGRPKSVVMVWSWVKNTMNDGRSHIMAVTRVRNDDNNYQEEEEKGEWRIVELVKRPDTCSRWILRIGDDQSRYILCASSEEMHIDYQVSLKELLQENGIPPGYYHRTLWGSVTYVDQNIPEGNEVSVCCFGKNAATLLRFDITSGQVGESPTFTRMTWKLPDEEKHTLTSPGSFLAAGLVLPLWCSNTGYLCFIDTTTGEKIGEILHSRPTCIAPVSDNLFVLGCLESFSLLNLEHLGDGPLWTIYSPEVACLRYVDGHILVGEGEFSGAKVTVYTRKGNKVKTLTNPPGKCIIGHFENEQDHPLD
ncbi:hypothetical protein Pelo_2114 [Pelomyxa schiedti]|nr:hypothetical protein Pelo_2114 [Pelomyxa schiedti]